MREKYSIGDYWAEIHQALLSQFSLLAEFFIKKKCQSKAKIVEF